MEKQFKADFHSRIGILHSLAILLRGRSFQMDLRLITILSGGWNMPIREP
jgi:hypothetical protein